MTGKTNKSTAVRLKLLLVEQNPLESKLLQELLLDSMRGDVEQDAGVQALEVHTASTLEDALAQIKQHSFDVALIDAVSRDIQHLGLFHAIKAKASDLAIIILIEQLDQKLLHKAMDEGVQDYLLKREVTSRNLVATIRHVALRSRLKQPSTEPRRVMSAASANLAEGVDGLTGLPQQALFIECLDYEIKRAHRYSQLIALMFIHIDGLDAVAEQAGEAGVKAVLLAYSARLKNILRTSDTTGRYGEHTFACILNDLSEQQDVHVVIGKVEAGLSAPVSFQSQLLDLADIKIGLALYPGDSNEVQSLLQCANTALDSARQKSGMRAEIFNSHIRAQDIERFKVADAVRYALEKNELSLYLQPVLELAQKKVVAVEASLHWEHPDYAEISSRDILFLAELAGLIQPVEEWLLRQACLQYGNVQKQHRDLKIRLHLPPGIFRAASFPALLKTILEETELAATSLQLAVPVSAIMQSPEKAKDILRQLDDLGVNILLDDFGGSHSSMQLLKTYPIKGLIIEELVIGQVGTHQDASDIVKTIIAMCQAMHLQLTAKGVETAAQDKLLASWHCSSVQGEYYTKAMAADAFFSLPLWDDVEQELAANDDHVRVQHGTSQCIRDSFISLNSLLPMSQSARQLLDIRNNSDAGIPELEGIIEQDPAIAAQIIRYANAPFFGNQGQIKTIKQAVMTALGFEGALNMALGIAVQSNLQSSGKSCIDLQAYWRHAIYTAALSQAIARQTRFGDVIPGTAWLAGLLQNIGYLALCQNFQPELEKLKVQRRQYPDLLPIEVEERVLGISHAEVGLHLLRGWHLPEEIVTAVFEHHNVSYVGEHAAYANIILIANRMLAKQGIGDEMLGLLSPGILQMLSLSEEQLEKIMNKIMDSRDELDTMGSHLVA